MITPVCYFSWLGAHPHPILLCPEQSLLPCNPDHQPHSSGNWQLHHDAASQTANNQSSKHTRSPGRRGKPLDTILVSICFHVFVTEPRTPPCRPTDFSATTAPLRSQLHCCTPSTYCSLISKKIQAADYHYTSQPFL